MLSSNEAGTDDRSTGSGWRKLASSIASQVRSDPARWGSLLLVSLASAAFAGWLLYSSRQQWFVTDEFDYFNSGSDPWFVWLLRPHNEHTIVFTKAWFGLLGHFVGLRDYALYMVPLVVGHLVVVAGVYRLTWISTKSRVITSGVALATLTVGAAMGTLTWAGQSQYVCSVAAGVIVVSLAIEGSGKRALAIAIVAAVFGTLNGSAFIAFGLAAAIVYVRRRMLTEGAVVAAIPIGWEVINRLVWAPVDPWAATGIGQILREGASFSYTILDAAISKTLHEPRLTSVVIAGLVLGTLTLLSLDLRWRRTPLSGRVVAVLALAAILTMLSLIVARLSLATDGEGYTYLFLVPLLTVAGILMSHVARSRASLIGIGAVLLIISLMGANDFHANADGLASWKSNAEHLLQTAAAELNSGMPTFEDQIPFPDLAPMVTQVRLRSLTAKGELDAVITGQLQADQVSLNMQWRLVPASQTSGVCRELAVGTTFIVPVGASASTTGLGTGAGLNLAYPGSGATRHFDIPATAATLETLSQRQATAVVAGAGVRVCMPSWP